MFRKLSDSISEKFSRKDDLGKQVEIVRVFDAYKELAGKFLKKSQIPQPLKLQRQVLTIAISSPSEASELRLHDADIVNQINKKFGKEVVRRIAYKF